METFLYTALEVEGCSAELLLNGIPISRILETPGRLPAESVAAETYAIAGENTLQLLVDPTPKGPIDSIPERRVDGVACRALARLVRLRIGETPVRGQGVDLATIDFILQGNEEVAFPQKLETRVQLEANCPRWAFQEAEPLVLDAGLLAEAERLLSEIEGHFRAGRPRELVALAERLVTDAIRAYPAITMQTIEDDYAKMVMHHFRADPPFLPRDPAKAGWRLVAGGRLLEIIDRDGTPSVKLCSPTTGRIIPYPLLLGRVGGRLGIVR